MYKISPWMVFCKHPMTCHTLKCKSTSLLKTKIILLFHLQQKHRSMVWKIKVFNYFPTHFEGTGQPSFWKNLQIFQSSYLVHARKFSWNPCWLERNLITTLVWIERKETCERCNRLARKSVTWFKKYTGWLQHQSYSDPIVILISLPRMSVWWNHLLVSRTTAK